MYYPKSCVVLGCVQKDRKVPRRVFPNFKSNPELFREWVVASGNPELLNFSTEHIHRNFRVCDKHFPREIAATGSKLPRNCIPNLHTPGAKSSFLNNVNKKFANVNRTFLDCSNLTSSQHIVEPCASEIRFSLESHLSSTETPVLENKFPDMLT